VSVPVFESKSQIQFCLLVNLAGFMEFDETSLQNLVCHVKVP